MPLIIGIAGGIGVFLVMFGTIYIYTECRKPKSIFREEATAEDILIKREFPKPKLPTTTLGAHHKTPIPYDSDQSPDGYRNENDMTS